MTHCIGNAFLRSPHWTIQLSMCIHICRCLGSNIHQNVFTEAATRRLLDYTLPPFAITINHPLHTMSANGSSNMSPTGPAMRKVGRRVDRVVRSPSPRQEPVVPVPSASRKLKPAAQGSDAHDPPRKKIGRTGSDLTTADGPSDDLLQANGESHLPDDRSHDLESAHSHEPDTSR